MYSLSLAQPSRQQLGISEVANPILKYSIDSLEDSQGFAILFLSQFLNYQVHMLEVTNLFCTFLNQNWRKKRV